MGIISLLDPFYLNNSGEGSTQRGGHLAQAPIAQLHELEIDTCYFKTFPLCTHFL